MIAKCMLQKLIAAGALVGRVASCDVWAQMRLPTVPTASAGLMIHGGGGRLVSSRVVSSFECLLSLAKRIAGYLGPPASPQWPSSCPRKARRALVCHTCLTAAPRIRIFGSLRLLVHLIDASVQSKLLTDHSVRHCRTILITIMSQNLHMVWTGRQRCNGCGAHTPSHGQLRRGSCTSRSHRDGPGSCLQRAGGRNAGPFHDHQQWRARPS